MHHKQTRYSPKTLIHVVDEIIHTSSHVHANGNIITVCVNMLLGMGESLLCLILGQL